MNFQTKFQNIVAKNNSLLCVGLDPELEKLPKGKSLFDFNKTIIDQTAPYVCAYKPNIAFYEAVGTKGLEELKKTIDYLKKNYKDIPIILDAKRADIPNTAKMYAKSAFEFWQADAVTVYPHLGLDSIMPFLEYKDNLTILLLKTSNPDSGMFQDLKVGKRPYFLEMAHKIKTWKFKNIGIFVGATYPRELQQLREVFPSKIFLSAGIGAQAAQNKKAVKAGVDKNGAGIAFNASRSIIYAQDPGQAAKELRDEINNFRK